MLAVSDCDKLNVRTSPSMIWEPNLLFHLMVLKRVLSKNKLPNTPRTICPEWRQTSDRLHDSIEQNFSLNFTFSYIWYLILLTSIMMWNSFRFISYCTANVALRRDISLTKKQVCFKNCLVEGNCRKKTIQFSVFPKLALAKKKE